MVGQRLPGFDDLVLLPRMEINSMIPVFKCHLTDSPKKVREIESMYILKQFLMTSVDSEGFRLHKDLLSDF